MAKYYKFYVLDPGQIEINSPINWRDISISYTFDYKARKFGEIPVLEFCDRALLERIEAKLAAGVCETLNLYIEEFDGKVTGGGLAYQGKLKLNEISRIVQPNNYNFTIPLDRESLLASLEETQDNDLSMITTTQLQLFQPESGGYYTNPDNTPVVGNFRLLRDVLNNYIDTLGVAGAGVVTDLGNASNTSYVPSIVFLIPDALPAAGSVIVVTLTGKFGQTYNITVTTPAIGWGNVDNLLEAIRLGFLWRVGQSTTDVNMRAWEFYSRVCTISIENSVQGLGKSLDIRAYFDIVSATVTVGGINVDWAQDSSLLPQRKSTGDLYISGQGLKPEISINWRKLTDLIHYLYGSHVQETPFGNGVTFATNEIYVQNVIYGANDPMNEPDLINISKQYNTEMMKRRLQGGYKFRISEWEKDRAETKPNPDNNEEYVQNWFWQGQEIQATNSDTTPPINPINHVIITTAGEGRLSGVLNWTRNAGVGGDTIGITIEKNGASIWNSNLAIGSPGNASFDLGSINLLLSAADKTFAVNDKVEVIFTSTAGDGQTNFSSTQPAWSVILEVPFKRPFLDEDEAYTHATQNLTAFTGCQGILNEQVDQDIYGGMGFPFTQIAEDRRTYDNTMFLSYKAVGADQCRRFEHQLYFNTGEPFVPTDLQGQVYSIFMYNSPLMFPNLLVNLSWKTPSAIEVPQYQFTNTVTVSNDGNYDVTVAGTVNFTNGPLGGDKVKDEIYTFEKCANMLNFYNPFINNNHIEFNSVDGVTGDSVLRSIRYNLGNGTLEIETEI